MGKRINGNAKIGGAVIGGASLVAGVDYSVRHVLAQVGRVPVVETKLDDHLAWANVKSESIDKGLLALNAKIDALLLVVTRQQGAADEAQRNKP